MIKIILVEDHIIVRDGIKLILQSEDNIEIIGEVSSYTELLNILENKLPDILIVDISLPDISGIEITSRISSMYPDIKVIILTMHIKEDFIFNSIKAGAKGYLPKNTSKKELLKAVNEINSGREYYTEEISNIILKSYIRKIKNNLDDTEDFSTKLTRREAELLKLFAQGVGNKEISEKLFISIRTVESHKNHIMNKLELKSNIDLLKFAIKNKIIEL